MSGHITLGGGTGHAPVPSIRAHISLGGKVGDVTVTPALPPQATTRGRRPPPMVRRGRSAEPPWPTTEDEARVILQQVLDSEEAFERSAVDDAWEFQITRPDPDDSQASYGCAIYLNGEEVASVAAPTYGPSTSVASTRK